MTDFELACITQVGQLRGAFIELYDSIGADPASPQDVARKLRVNKTLAWNVARLLQSADELAAVAHVPGASSLEKVIGATAKHGADPNVVAKARAAVRDFDSMIRAHAGDRPTLDLIIDGTGSAENGRLELSRKLAFRGNSGLYGVQARTRVVSNFLAPNQDDPSRLDIVFISGYIDFRRLRPGVRWPIFRSRHWGTSADVTKQEPAVEAVEPSDDATEGFPVMPSFLRGNVPKIQRVVTVEGRDFVLDAGPVGNEGAFDCFWGEVMRQVVPRYAESEDDSTGEFGATIAVPTERLIMDVIVDEDVEFALKPELLVFGHIFAHGRPTGRRDDPSLLPIQEPIRPLTGGPPLVNTPSVPNYAKLVSRVYERMNWDPKRFRGVRLTLDFPPLGSNVLLRFPLPVKHAAKTSKG